MGLGSHECCRSPVDDSKHTVVIDDDHRTIFWASPRSTLSRSYGTMGNHVAASRNSQIHILNTHPVHSSTLLAITPNGRRPRL